MPEQSNTSGDGQFVMLAVGDVAPNRDDPAAIFRLCRDEFQKADLVFGQLEFALSDKMTSNAGALSSVGAIRLPAKSISALTEEGAGFDIMSFACNHAMDFGEQAFLDTIDALAKNNIAVVGAGSNLAEARKPAIVERNGTKVGYLGYISVVPPGLEAEENHPGCAALRVSHSFKQWDWQPGTPPLVITQLLPEYRAAMEEDIRKLRPQVDVLVVSMHAGVHFAPSVIAMYQKEASYAAIDAGADLIVQHHAHILKGIEMYKGKAIFYSLGNFGVDEPFKLPGTRKGDPEYRKMKALYGIRPVPGYEKHTFHFDALKTMMVKAYVKDKKIEKVTYVPCYITPDLEPEVLERSDARAQQVFDYVKHVSENENLNVEFAWVGNEVLVSQRE